MRHTSNREIAQEDAEFEDELIENVCKKRFKIYPNRNLLFQSLITPL